MEKSSFLDFVERYPKYGQGLSTLRMKQGFERLKSRHVTKFPPVIHVVGSNGKGSTCHILEAALGYLGLRVGMFTSPHYYAFNERFRIGGANVSDEALAVSIDTVSDIADRLTGIGGFEVMTLIAADLFLREPLDVLVIEAGVGGRFDATRAFGGSVGILTSVDLEHTEILGESLEAIIADKVDIVSPGGVVFTGWVHDAALAFGEAHASESQRRLIDVSKVTRLSYEANGEIRVSTEIGTPPLEMTWCPVTPVDYLPRNAVLGLHAVEALALTDVTSRDLADAFTHAVNTVRLIGRFETLSDAPPTICDFAHTPAAAREVVASCERLFKGRRVIGVVGISFDKNHVEMLGAFAEAWGEFLVFSARHKGLEAARLEAQIMEINPRASVQVFDDIGELVERVKTEADDNAVFIATGGIFSVMEFRSAFLGIPLASLKFF
jgi:dihydrofolate synthase/folylpolyglutamate synthase